MSAKRYSFVRDQLKGVMLACCAADSYEAADRHVETMLKQLDDQTSPLWALIFGNMGEPEELDSKGDPMVSLTDLWWLQDAANSICGQGGNTAHQEKLLALYKKLTGQEAKVVVELPPGAGKTKRDDSKDTSTLVSKLRDSAMLTTLPQWARKDMEAAADMLDELAKVVTTAAEVVRSSGEVQDSAVPPEPEWITNLKRELVTNSKVTHMFSFTRDETMELLGGMFKLMSEVKS